LPSLTILNALDFREYNKYLHLCKGTVAAILRFGVEIFSVVAYLHIFSANTVQK